MPQKPSVDALISRLDPVPVLPMGAAALSVDLVKLPLSPERSFDVSALKIAAALQADLRVSAFNSPDDNDPLGVLGTGGSESDDQPPPALKLDGQTCWLKYAVAAAIKADGGLTLAHVGFSFDLASGVELADYRVHAPSRQARVALAEDLQAGLRFALRLEDVKALQPNEALALRVRGSLSLSAEVAWSDVLAYGLRDVSRALGIVGALSVAVEAGAKVAAELTVDDEFLLIFSRRPDGRFAIGVRKAAGTAGRIRGTLGVAAFAKDVSPDLVDRVIAAATGIAKRDLDNLLRDFESLSPEERGALERVAARLAVPLLGADPVKQIKDKWKSLEERARTALETAAKQKFEAGFTYEYNRVAQDCDLLCVRATEAALERHHGHLVRGRLTPVLAELADKGKSDLALERYLNQTTLTTKRALGFSLGYGRWTISSKDMRSLTAVTRRSIGGDRQQVSYLGARSYDSGWLGDTLTMTVDFRADMKAMSLDVTPRLNEFTFGLALTWSSQPHLVSTSDLDEALDVCALWNVLAQDDIDEVRRALKRLVGARADVTVQLILGDEALRAVMDRATKTVPADTFCAPLAAALPLWDDHAERLSPRRRIDAYRSVWADHLNRPALRLDDLSYMVGFHLEQQGMGHMATIEAMQASHAASFRTIVERNPNTVEAAGAFHNALAGLGRAVQSGAPDHDVIKAAFARMHSFWAQTLHVRALGVYCQHALNAAGLHGRARASLKVTPSQGEELTIG